MTESVQTHRVRLDGCRTRPLSSYLMALGVFRLVAEQADRKARGAWQDGVFVLESCLDESGLRRFFQDTYRPTPVLSPWNGGSGFFPNDNKAGIEFVGSESGTRFVAYQDALGACRRALADLGLDEKPEKDQKPALVEALRSELPDAALAWLDAALVLTNDGARFPPLLGTGGNDGRLDFSNNFMGRLTDIFGPLPEAPKKQAAERIRRQTWLACALFGVSAPGLTKGAVGQFDPAGAGGANAGPGESFDTKVSPWTFVLMIEGAMALAASSSRKLESTSGGELSFPFSVRSSGAGYGSATAVEEGSGRDELWLPLWAELTGWPDIAALLREGRARVGRRTATTGVDFARAIAGLGVSRGLSAFERYGFHVRNGLAYQAVPLGTWPVRRNPRADLLAPLDRWLDRFRRATASDSAPASLRRARRGIDDAVLSLCGTSPPTAASRVLVELGRAERQMVRSLKFCIDSFLPPVPWLPPAWLHAARDDSREFRLASALASAGLRARATPLEAGRARWNAIPDASVGWIDGDLVRSLQGWLLRRELSEVVAGSPPRLGVSCADLAWWLEHPESDRAVEELALGLALVDLHSVSARDPSASAWLPPTFALMHLCVADRTLDGATLPRTPGLLQRACSGDADGATRLALRRLKGAGVRLRMHDRPRTQRPWSSLPHPSGQTRRLAAALAFPLSPTGRQSVRTSVINNRSEPTGAGAQEPSPNEVIR